MNRDRLEGEATRRWLYERFGMADTEPKAKTEPTNGQIVHPCAPEGYNGPTAPDGWPIGVVEPKIPY